MKRESNSTLLLVVSLVCLSGAAILLSQLPEHLLQNTSKIQTKKSIINESIANIDNVLSITPHYDFFTYTSGFDNPFRKHGVNKASSAVTSTSKKELSNRPKLLLKGILLKNKGLAIIEDESGQTYIRGAGEIVLNQQIVSINPDKVVFRDRAGIYELAVEEY